MLLCIVFVLAFALHPAGKKLVKDFFCPDEVFAARQALETMAQRIQTGIPVADAVDSFCRDVMSVGR